MESFEKWENVGVLETSFSSNLCDLDITECEEKQMVLVKDISVEDNFIDRLIYNYHGNYKKRDFLYKELIEKRDSHIGDNPLEIYVSFDSWEEERKVIDKLKSEERSVVKKNKIENNFSLFNSVYFSKSEIVELSVDSEGINYLDSPYVVNSTISGKVINCSFAELKKLYNVTGSKLFRSNVRDGINDSKATIRSIFRNYLSIESDDMVNEDTEISESNEKLIDFDSELFWYSHNGITLFIDKSVKNAFNFQNDSIKINSKACSVINGAQTITNFFLVYSELKNNYYDLKETGKKAIKRLDSLLSRIFVKLTIIIGDKTYSPFITKGLNTQNPITQEDFLAISEKVAEINKVSNGYVYILKTGEVPRDGGVTPLQFVKNFLIAVSRPGYAKNFSTKKGLEEEIDKIHKKLVGKNEDGSLFCADKLILEKMSELYNIEIWWKKKNSEKGKNRDIIDNYGKNYFQSFVLDKYYHFIEGGIDLTTAFEKFEELLKTSDIEYNVFKRDELYNKIINDFEENQSTSLEKDFKSKVYEKNLLDYLSKDIDSNRDINYQMKINKFNEENNYRFENLRVVRRINKKIGQHFHLSTKTFNSLYQDLDIERKLQDDIDINESDFKDFSNSILYEELNKSYNIYLLDFEEDKLTNVTFFENIKFDLLENFEKEVKKSYTDTIEAFITGDISKFPKANKETKVHVRPKALSKDDSFVFTDGESLTKRTFWITRYYLNDFLLEKEKEKEQEKNG